MSTVITSAYNSIYLFLGVIFPNHETLLKPLQPEYNDSIYFEQAYGVSFDSGSNSNRQIDCSISIKRNVTITLTRKFYSGDLQRNDGAILEKRDAEKLLLEDQFTLLKETENNDTLQGGNKITKFHYVSDGGIEYIADDERNAIMIKTVFEMEYLETL